MKNTLNFVLLFVLFVGFNTQVFSQEKDYETEILVYFLSDSLEMPDGIASLTDMNRLKIKSKDLSKSFRKIKLKSIKKAFPDFNQKDILKTTKEGRKIKLPNMSRIFKLKLRKKDDVASAIFLLSKEKSVLFAEPNGVAQPETTPNDSLFSNQWGLSNGGADIHATQAWDIYKGNSNNIIAIIDGGINKTHPDLQSKVSAGDNGFGWNGHGIHVAGIAAASTNNNDGIAGVDWYAKIHPQRVDNTDDVGTYNAIIDAVNYNSKVYVLNNSWSLVDNYYNPRYSSTVRMGFAYAYKMNRVAVVSMGNESTSATYYPAGFGQGIIAVGATTSSDGIANYSNTGNHIDVSAPGSYIYSTYTNDDYDYLNGTSMAAPHVSGIASLLKGYNSNLYNDDIEQIIRISADDKGASGWDSEYGTGRVNAKSALDYLRPPYVLHHKSASGGTDYHNDGYFPVTFYGVDGFADGTYHTERHEVRKTVNFGQTYQNTHVWARGVGTDGYSAENPNFAMGWCSVVSNNNSSATLKTYVYQVWNNWMFLGWYPTSPSGVSFNYTVLGTPAPVSVSISGPSFLSYRQTGTFTATGSNGFTPYTYAWYIKFDGSSNWSYIGSGSSRQYTMGHTAFTLKAIVTDDNDDTAEDTHYVDNSFWKKAPGDGDGKMMLPEEYSLGQNFPNPFNPTTTIKYDLKESGFVRLNVYNVKGQVVKKLANKAQSAGRYESTFDASSLPSGLYYYSLEAGSLKEVRKMILMK